MKILTPPRSIYCQLIIPEEAPLSVDVDFEQLAEFEMTGGSIKSAVFRAASRAALRDEGNNCIPPTYPGLPTSFKLKS